MQSTQTTTKNHFLKYRRNGSKTAILLYLTAFLPISAVNVVSAGFPTVASVHKIKNTAPPSSLDSDGSYYQYQGHPVRLIRLNERLAFSFRNQHGNPATRLKNKRYFKRGTFQGVQTKKIAVEVMHFDSTLTAIAVKKGFNAAIDTATTAVFNDSSIAFTSPVYYNPQLNKQIILTNRVIVAFSDNVSPAQLRTISTLLDADLDSMIMPLVYTFTCRRSRYIDALHRCHSVENLSDVKWVEPEILSEINHDYIPNDQLFNHQWSLNNNGSNGAKPGADIKAVAAWDLQQGSDQITIAVIDDGVDLKHPDLLIKNSGYDFYNDDNEASPDAKGDNHGTAVAGIAAAIGNNTLGIVGVAAGTAILPIKVSQEMDFIASTGIAQAITWAYENGADILNNCWGGTTPTNVVTTAIRNASTLGRGGKGCPVFFSAGNAGSTFISYNLNFPDSSEYSIAFVYKKDALTSKGDDGVVMDNVTIYGKDHLSVLFTETFEGGGLPTGWSTSGGVVGSISPDSTIDGWSPTSDTFASGFGDRIAFRSGSITHNQWTELRLPLRTFQAGEQLQFIVSLSTEYNYDVLAIRYYQKDGTLVNEIDIGSGINTSHSTVQYPASADSAIAVGSSNDQDYRSEFSQYDVSGTGKTVDFLAPSNGGLNKIFTTDRTGIDGYTDGDYDSTFNGTSASCPAAAGIAALILARNPDLSRNKVLEVMRSTCDKIGNVTYLDGVNNEYGRGRLNAYAALSNLPPVITEHNPLAVLRNSSLTITIADLIIYDTETPDGPFTLSVYNGKNYTCSGTTISPTTNFVGTLSVTVSVNDGTYESDPFTCTVTMRATNTAPVIAEQNTIKIPEDTRRNISIGDLTISDPDDPSGPFVITINSGDNYQIINDTIVPDPDFYGTLTIPIAVSDGFTTSATYNFIMQVTPINDPPSFTQGSDQQVNEDAGPVTVANWATDISPGVRENSQTLTFLVSTTDSSLFSDPPTINKLGTLTFTPAPNMNGSTPVFIRLFDDGGTDNSGIDSSDSVTMTISVVAVNDPPELTISGRKDIPINSVSELIISATDPDKTTPQIRVENLPSFATFSTTSGSGIATISFAPDTDTGSFTFTIIADDTKLSVDTTVTINVYATGAIVVTGVPAEATTTLYATAGWIGKPVLTGPGTVAGLTPGNYLLSISHNGFRREYYSAIVPSGGTDTISVALRPSVPITLGAPDTLRTATEIISAEMLVSVVLDDINNDGTKDLLYTGTDGVIWMAAANDDIFKPPVTLLSTISGKKVLRCIDWNEDGVPDLLTVNSDGSVRITYGLGDLKFEVDSVLFTLPTGCTSIEVIPDKTGNRAFYSGYSNGTVLYSSFSNDGRRTDLDIHEQNGDILDIGDDASIALFDVTGDGKYELLISGNDGTVTVFTRTSTDTVHQLGSFNSCGQTVTGQKGIKLSTTFGMPGELPAVIYSDGNGRIFRSIGTVQGDINNDGKVNVLDLQQLGIHWGQQETDSKWYGPANLQVNPASSFVQIINVLDLQILGNCWGNQK